MVGYKHLYSNGQIPLHGRVGIDLRAELEQLFNDDITDLMAGRFGIARLMKLDDNEEPILCSCRAFVSSAPDPKCSVCLGEGFLWKEYWVEYYKTIVSGRDSLSTKKRRVEFGMLDVPYALFYLRYLEVNSARMLKSYDKIIEVDHDLEGKIIKPIRRRIFWDINMCQEYFSDGNRTEYWRIAARSEDLWTDAGNIYPISD